MADYMFPGLELPWHWSGSFQYASLNAKVHSYGIRLYRLQSCKSVKKTFWDQFVFKSMPWIPFGKVFGGVLLVYQELPNTGMATTLTEFLRWHGHLAVVSNVPCEQGFCGFARNRVGVPAFRNCGMERSCCCQDVTCYPCVFGVPACQPCLSA